ncbi:MAG: class I SAM-dependent methyltransferase [Phycisphaerae bacterium]|nr:class I SAM-dependent methyltransferase [Phycisphaerae bacterium]
MADHVCHWRHAYLFDNVLRRLLHNPRKLFGSYVGPGSTAMDVGCGMGFNAIGMAKLVGDDGRVIAVDLQPEMLEVVRRRADRAGVAHRVRTHQCSADSIDISEPVDFIVAFWMVHEVPDAGHLLRELHACLRSGGKLFAAEPSFHVKKSAFEEMIRAGEGIGLTVHDRPGVRWSLGVVLAKP